MNLAAQDLHFAYEAGRPVLSGVSLTAAAGSVVLLFGPNGCGKSTLLRCLGGGLRPQLGCVRIEGDAVGGLDPRERARRIAVVPQEERQDIPFTVFETVMFGRHPYGGRDREADRRAAWAAMERMDLLDLARRPFTRLSGGERQRVLIARALAQGGGVLLLDEPAAHLDYARHLAVLGLIRELAREGRAIVMAAHDVVMAPMIADECILMNCGVVAARGKPAEALCARQLEAVYGKALTVDWRDDGEIRLRVG